MNGDEANDSQTEAAVGAHDGHGTLGEPEALGAFDYGVVGVSVVIVIITFYLAVRYLLWPGESDDSHIKRTILEDEP